MREMEEQEPYLRRNFDIRYQECKNQAEEFKQINEAIEALKKVRDAEIANHVQQYNALLTEKLNSEDALRADHLKMKNILLKLWQAKLQETVKSARAEEQTKADEKLAE